MDKEQRERLEQELRFLKESLEADVISKDDYERGKERIERKLKEIEERPEEKVEEEPKEEKEEIKEEPKIEIKEIKEEHPKRIEEVEEEKEPEEGEVKEEAPKVEEKKEEEAEEKEEEKKEGIEEEKEPTEGEPKKEEKEEPEEIKISKKWLYGMAILIIAAILFFSIRGCYKPMEETQLEEKPTEEFTPVCSSNSDCKQEGMVGICLNPDTKEAKCEFKEDIRTNLIVIDDRDCKLCDSSGMKKIIKEIFPNVKIKEIDYETAEAKRLIDKFDINALPAYIFDSNVSEAINFNDFKTALIKKGNNYVIANTASGAIYYFKRLFIKNKLDLYVLPETTEKIEASMQEVLNLFKDKINFTKHIVIEGQKDILERELAINTYPAFLLNNQLKFRGVLPANIIKERICDINYFEECSKELSKV